MRYVYSNDGVVKKQIGRDAHDGEMHHYIETNEFPVAERNKKIRNAGLIVEGRHNPVLDDVVEAQLQIPSVADMNLAKRKDPELWEGIRSRDSAIRHRATQRLKILYPHWVVSTPRGDRRRGR